MPHEDEKVNNQRFPPCGPDDISRKFDVRSSVVVAGISVSTLVNQDPKRTFIFITNTGPGAALIAPEQLLNNTRGHRIGNNETISIHFREWGGVVTHRWTCIREITSNANLFISEVIYLTRR